MTDKKQNKMVLTCHKCGRQWESEVEYQDEVSCPKCGKHGKITSSNTRAVKTSYGIMFVPAG